MTRLLIAIALVLAVSGCAKNYVITTDLSDPLADQACVQITEVRDLLPEDTDPDNRPTAEDVAKFKTYLAEEFAAREELAMAVSDAGCPYEVQSSLLSYKKGSGFMRFLIGFGAGNSKVVTELKMVDTRDGSTVFAGNFTGEVASWTDTGDKMFKTVSRTFTKQLEKRVQKLAEK
jgi:hypothetical protein